jgi:farnesyl diphosphate synthase
LSSFKKMLAENAADVEECLDQILRPEDVPEARLIKAMRYGTLNGGKRVRPFLVMATSRLFGVWRLCGLRTAAAVEMVHCYSLIHDDLPAMDDDDLRRGQPTCHKKFDEATAILAGDALLTKAFEVLGDVQTHSDPQVRCDLVVALATAAGHQGMCGGQMLDLIAETTQLDVPAISRLQRLKTGKLIAVSCEAGAILGKAPLAARVALTAFAHDIGLAFQIVDDLLDVEGDEEDVGKKTNKDAAAGKATFVSLLGVERARSQADLLKGQAIAHLDSFGDKADPLRELARFIVVRRN